MTKLYRTEDEKSYSHGYHFARGVINHIFHVIIIFWIISLVLDPVVRHFTATDDTDLNKQTRSGFTLMTDYGTGQEYLKVPGVGIIKREVR